MALGKLGNPALPALTKAYHSERWSWHGVCAISTIKSPQAIAILADGLKSPRAQIRRETAQVLSGVLTNDARIMQTLIELVQKDDNSQVRIAAVRTITFYGGQLATSPLARQAAPTVAAALIDDHPDLRKTAYYATGAVQIDPTKILRAHFLGKDQSARIKAAALMASIDAKNVEARDALKAALEDKNAGLRYQAAFALVDTTERPPALVDVLIEALSDEKPLHRQLAMISLRFLSTKTSKAVPALIKLTADEDKMVRRQAINTLGYVGSDSKMVLPVLAALFKDGDRDIRQSAISAMHHQKAADVLPYFKIALGDKTLDMRLAAIVGLGMEGIDANVALPLLAQALRDEEPTARLFAVHALARHGGGAVPLYLKALTDKRDWVRKAAAEGVSYTGEPGLKAVPALVHAARNDMQANVREAAVAALVKLGDGAIPGLAELIATREPGTRRNAVTALRNLGAKAKPAVPGLIAVLKTGDRGARMQAATILGTIGPDARDAVAALKDAARDPDPDLQEIAMQALEKIENK